MLDLGIMLLIVKLIPHHHIVATFLSAIFTEIFLLSLS